MKIKKHTSIFKEARFVFGGGGEAKPDVVAAAPIVAPTADVETAPADAPAAEPAKVEVKKATGAELLSLATSLDLAKLKDKMINFNDLMRAVGVNGADIEGEMKGSVDLSKLGADIKPKMDELFNKKNPADFNALGDLLRKNGEFKDFKNEDVKDFLAVIYKNSAVAAVTKSFKEKYPNFDAFVKSGGVFESMKYKIKIDGSSDFKPEFTMLPTDFEEKYKAFKPSASTGEVAEVDKDVSSKAVAIEKSWLGKMMVHLGLVKKGEFEDVVSGGNSIAAFVIGLFGGKHLLTTGVFEEMTADLQPKHAKMLASAQKAASGSPLNLAKAKPAESAAILPIDFLSTEFVELIEGKRNFPQRGVNLKEDVDLGDKVKLKIDLAAAELVIPKGASLMIDGKHEGAGSDGDKVFKNRVVEITGTMKKGVMLKGKPVFEIV